MPVQLSLPWDKDGGGDAGPFTHLTWNELFKAWHNNNGYVVGSGDGSNAPLAVIPSSPESPTVRIAEGLFYFVGGYLHASDGFQTLTLVQNTDVNDRIDLIVVRRIVSNQQNRLALVQGTPAASPVAPYASLQSNEATTYEVAIAEVLVPGNSGTQIFAGDITNVAIAANWWRNASISAPFTEFDMLVADSVGDLRALTGGGNYKFPIGNAANTPPYEFGDARPTRIYDTLSTANELIATPVPIDGSDDSSALMRAAVSSSRFYPKAKRLRLVHGGVSVFAASSAVLADNYCYLYDANAAANITDVDGNLARTMSTQFGVSTGFLMGFPSYVMEFAGTENVEIRISGDITNKYLSVSSVNKGFPISLSFIEV